MTLNIKSKSWEFNFRYGSIGNYNECIDNIIQFKNEKSFFTYKKIEKDVVGYIILNNSTTLYHLLKINDCIKWKKTTANFIKGLCQKNILNNPNSKKSSDEELKELQDEYDNLKNDYNNLKNKYDNLKNEYDIYVKEVNNEKSVNTINIHQNNIQNINITINSYKQPSIEHIKNREYKRFLDCYELNGITNLLEAIYFNPNIKENHNMYIPHDRYSGIIVFENNSWVVKNKDQVVGEICHTCSNNIMGWYESVSDQDQTDETIVYLSDEEKEKYKDITELKTDQLIDKSFVNKHKDSIINLIKSNKDLGKFNNKLFNLQLKQKQKQRLQLLK